MSAREIILCGWPFAAMWLILLIGFAAAHAREWQK